MLSCHGRSNVQHLSNKCSPINRRKQKHLHLGYMRDHMTGFLCSYQMAELSDSREPFQIAFPRTSRKMFPSRTTKSKTSAGWQSEKPQRFLTAHSCNPDKIAGNLIRLVPPDFLKDERQCQTLQTIRSCLYKQALVSVDIKQSLGHVLSIPVGLAPALSPGSHGGWRGQQWDIPCSKNTLPVLPLVPFRNHLLYSLHLPSFGGFQASSSSS